MDKGFYSKKNVDELIASKSTLLVSVPLNKWVQHAIENSMERLSTFIHSHTIGSRATVAATCITHAFGGDTLILYELNLI